MGKLEEKRGQKEAKSISLPQVTMGDRDRHFEGMRTVHHQRAVSNGQPDYARKLVNKLADTIEGEVRFDAGSRATYSTDASNYRQVPMGVVIPKSADDVIQVHTLCRQFGAPICTRGGGTSLAGQATNFAVLLDFSKYMNKVISIDPDKQTAVVEPGCVLDTLREKAERDHQLTFGPDPATHSRCTIGGMIGNNACGIHSVMAQHYGHGPMTADQVESLEILTGDGERMTVGPTSREELDRIIKQGGRKGEIYEKLARIGRQNEQRIRERFPNIPRRASGYNLDRLLPNGDFNLAQALVGSEGTCAIILSATVKLQHFMPARALVVMAFPSVEQAGDACPKIMSYKPTACEGMDDKLIEFMKKKGLHPQDIELLPEGKGFLIVEFGADEMEDAEQQARSFMDDYKDLENAPTMRLFTDDHEKEQLWQVRESGLGATAHVHGMAPTRPGWEDASVRPENLGDYLRDFQELLDEFGYSCSLYGHFGQACVHCRIDFDLFSRQGINNYLKFIERAAKLAVKHGGSLSGEHGDGLARSSLLPIMYGDELVQVFGEFKSIWDPENQLNPGKIVESKKPDDDLREGPDHKPAEVETYFKFPNDGNSFANAAGRCVGVGKCRQDQSGTMCPSYMVTREEEDSTRGRARLLYEMLRGGVSGKGFRDKHTKEALDLCLACKGCVNECPVNVDMATYKAEFNAHYYKGRLRPIQAYSMGWIYWWARIGTRMAPLVNFVTGTPPLSNIVKWMGGISQRREAPKFASPNFKRWFAEREAKVPTGETETRHRGEKLELEHSERPDFAVETYEFTTNPHYDDGKRLNIHAEQKPFDTTRVLLWPDTFSNYLKPGPAKSTVRLLEWAGCQVELPDRPLCCGRPLYDFGFLGMARKMWRQVIEHLRPWIREGVPIIGIEPSCTAAFRDELVNMYPNDMDAKRLAHSVFLVSEYMVRQRIRPPQMHRKAILHAHCHHKAVMHMDAEIAVLKAMGMDFEMLDSGCCGMAGSFGFDRNHFEVSRRAGERVLLPSVRQVDDDTLIIADGFSCREQIRQLTNRRAYHLSEIVEMSIDASERDESTPEEAAAAE